MNDNEFYRDRYEPIKALSKQKKYAVENSLGKDFIQNIETKNFDAAHQIIKNAINLNYPQTLINSWRERLDKLENTHRHPLDSLTELTTSNINLSCQIGANLREIFQSNIEGYFKENGIKNNSISEFVEFVFNSLDQISGKISILDITSYQPSLNLISYSVEQYLNESPDILTAIER